MNRQRVLSLVRKDLKKLVREPATLFLIVLFPVVLTLGFGVGFGAIGGDQAAYEIGLVNEDSEGMYPGYSEYFRENLTHLQILNIHGYSDNATAQADLMQGNIQAVIVIPEDFGLSVDSYWTSESNSSLWVNATVQLYLDSGSMVATQAIPPIIQQVLETTVNGEEETHAPAPIRIGSPSLVESSTFTTFDYMAPGIFAFGAIFLIMTVATSFTEDRQQGLLRRINTTPTKPSEFMMSQTMSSMVAATIQVIIIFLTAFAVGYRPLGGAFSLMMAFVIVLIFSLAMVGFGLITATISKSPGAATGIAFIFIMPMMFLGTFVTAGMSSTAQAAGAFVPSHYVTDALTSLFLRGAPVTSPSIMLDLGVISITSVVVLMIGIVLFRKYGKA
ncbi:MAG: ABC transporter permease [Thermoplasmata archaeon]